MDGSWCGPRQSMHTMRALNLAGYTPFPVTIPVYKIKTARVKQAVQQWPLDNSSWTYLF